MLVSGGVSVATDRLGTVRANNQGEQMAYYPYGEERTSTGDGRDKYGTYFRDEVGQDYAEQRYYGAGTGRFWTVDPGGMGTASRLSPTSLNQYALVQGDPVNRVDRHGMADCLLDDSCPDLVTGDGGNGPCDADSQWMFGGDLGWGFVEMPTPSCYGSEGDDFTSGPEITNCGLEVALEYGPLDASEQLGVAVILGENSWNYIGMNMYNDGDRYGHGTGPVLTASEVFNEDELMADVILNRGTTPTAGAFNGLPTGLADYAAYRLEDPYSSDCQDLLYAVGAYRSQEDGPRISTSVLYWVATVQGGRARHRRPGDARVGDTDFSVQPFGSGTGKKKKKKV
jgi:RHS repeat-associated protein